MVSELENSITSDTIDKLKKSVSKSISLFWFRRDLRLNDNAGLFHALKEKKNVLPIFIFDKNILAHFKNPSDARVEFIHSQIINLKTELKAKYNSDLAVFYSNPFDVYTELVKNFKIDSVYCNQDYEPKAIERDNKVFEYLNQNGIVFKTFKDQCLFEKNEILTDQKRPYTVYTPYKNKVLKTLDDFYLKSYPSEMYLHNLILVHGTLPLIELKDLGYVKSSIIIPSSELTSEMLKHYAQKRDFPALNGGTSLLGIHLRFGTVSVRELAREAKKFSEVWLSELIWRDFFKQIMFHFPFVEGRSFRADFEKVPWRINADEFQRWCEGRTGYPLVDAGMRELNQTGHMHNRVRMVVASFLTKHLLMHWSVGENYFSQKLLDYDLSANNGNWQWAAGSGCDAAPYFRIFNPKTQHEKFDPHSIYIKKWVPEYATLKYEKPMIIHEKARQRALDTFQKVFKEKL